MFYHVKEASAPVISGSVHPQEASWSLITTPGCRRVRALCDPGYQLRVAVVVWEAQSHGGVPQRRDARQRPVSQPCTAGTCPIIITQVLGLEPR